MKLENDIPSQAKLFENRDYELIPAEEEDVWDIRILTGDYIETVIQFKTVSMDDQGYIRYNFEVVSTPYSELTPEDSGLQEVASEILYSIIESSVRETANGNDRKTHHKQHTQE